MVKCRVCGRERQNIILFCEKCLGINRNRTFQDRIRVIILLDKEKKNKSKPFKNKVLWKK